MCLGPARGGELWEGIADGKKAAVPAGELSLVASGVVLCKQWSAKGGAPTCMRPATTSIVLDIDSLAPHTSRAALAKVCAPRREPLQILSV